MPDDKTTIPLLIPVGEQKPTEKPAEPTKALTLKEKKARKRKVVEEKLLGYGPPEGVYCEKVIEPLTRFEEKSLHWRRANKKTWQVVGCAPESWRVRAKRCRTAVRVHKVFMTAKGKRNKCLMDMRRTPWPPEKK